MTADQRTPVRRMVRWLTKPIAPGSWDFILWASGGVSLAGILLMAFLPAVGDLAVFFSLSLLINGPYGSLLPTAYEPIVMVFARLHPPLLIALIGAAAATLVEYVNYYVFHAALHSRIAQPLREARTARRVLRWFAVQPFATITVCAIVPIPFWFARGAATLANYPLHRHLAASGMGRFVRLTFYGYLGTVIKLSSATILLLGGLLTTILFVLILVRARRHTSFHGPPSAIEADVGVPGRAAEA